MNRRLRRWSAAALLFIALALQACAQSRTITILHANDTHSALFAYGSEDRTGGISRLTEMIRRLRADDPNALALHAGDAFVGSFEFNKYLGYPELKIMEDYYDAMALGNHEFDLGLDVLTGVLTGALGSRGPVAMPILCANLDASGTPLAEFVRPKMVLERGGWKIGLTGVVTRDEQHYAPEVLARIGDPLEAAGLQAARLRGEGCDLVICLSHLGLMMDRLGLSRVPGIDVIVGGHSHDALEIPLAVNGKVIVQAGAHGARLGELVLESAPEGLSVRSYTLHSIDGDGRPNPRLQSYLNELREGIVQDPRFGPVFTEHVATAEESIAADWPAEGGNRDSGLGNLVSDAIRAGVRGAGFQADIALEARGFIASTIPAGKVVGNDVLRAVPYGYDPASGLGFKVRGLLLAGTQILAGLEYSVSLVEYTNDLCMQPSGLTFRYDSSRPAAPLGELSRVDPGSVLVDGEPLRPDGLYWVAVNEKVAGMLIALGVTPFDEVSTGLFEYALVRDHMKALNRVRSVSEGRVIDLNAGR